MNLKYIIKYFFTTINGRFRASYLMQISSVIFSSFILSSSFIIMDGMEYEVFNRINSFNYKYKKINSIYPDSLTDKFNEGLTSLAKLKYKTNDALINVNTYKNIDLYKYKIYKYLDYPISLNNDTSIIIGKSLADYLNITIGDTLVISDILNINVVSGSIYSQKFVVSNIFNFKFLNYDYENVFIKHNNFLFKKNTINTYSDFNSNNDYISNHSEYNELISSIKLEKYLYLFLGILIALISAIIIFNNTMLVLLEKKAQIINLITIGISQNKFINISIFLNVVISSISALLGIGLSLILFYVNMNTNILDFLFKYSPFSKLPMLILYNRFLIVYLIIVISTIVSTLISILCIKKIGLNN